MCCPGCQAVAQSIVEFGFTDYYDTRANFATTAAGHELVPPELRLSDSEQPVHDETETSEAIYSIQNIRCAACVWLIERRLAHLLGVLSANVNAATERLHIRWKNNQCKASDILITLRTIGYNAFPFNSEQHSEQLERARKKLFRQLFIAGLSMMQVMMYAVPNYLATDIDADMTQLMRWASLLLTLPALIYSAQPFFRGAWQDIKNRMPGMDVPVALGITAAFSASSVATWRGGGEVYFDSVTMFIFLLLCSRYLELSARRKAASELDKLQHALPASAVRMMHFPQTRETELVTPIQLRFDDVILIKPGEVVPADSLIVEGASTVDLSLLTGESFPQPKSVGESIQSGSVNITQPLVARVTHTVNQSTLSVLIGLINRAGQSKPHLALWANRVAAWFVTALLIFSVAVFCVWQWIDPERAWPIAIAVLVVSCPCALSLATPTALAAATNRLLQQGVLVVQSHVLETLQRATHIVFDKTGTLTQGKPLLQQVVPLSYLTATACLRIAAAMEQSSNHPLAEAISNAAGATNCSKVDDIRHVVGQGIEARVDGIFYRLGNLKFVDPINQRDLAPSPAPRERVGERARTTWTNLDKDPTCNQQRNLNSVASPANTLSPNLSRGAGEGATSRGLIDKKFSSEFSNEFSNKITSIFLASNENLLAHFSIADAIRPDASTVVRHFQQQGKNCILLSGDRQPITENIASQLNIPTAIGDCLPENKLSFVQQLQKEGAVVAMIGDGINDAAVLRAADVSFAMGSGAALAQTNADCVLLSKQLSALTEADNIATKTLTVIHQNLMWATLYNALAIPAAAFGLINPWLSAIGMSLSSAVVVLNALRLR